MKHKNLIGSLIIATSLLSAGAIAANLPDQEYPHEFRSNSAMTSTIKAMYSSDFLVKDAQIEVSNDSGEVQLKGTVESNQQRNRAVDIALNVEGVDQVDDAIMVSHH